MTRSIADIEEEIRALGRAEQQRLLRALLEELDGPPDMGADGAWLSEIQRRSADFDAGLIRTTAAEEVIKRVRAQLKQ